MSPIGPNCHDLSRTCTGINGRGRGNKTSVSIQCRWSDKAPARCLQQVGEKVRHVVWTSFQNKLCLEWLNIDEMDLGARLHSTNVTNHRVVNEFCRNFDYLNYALIIFDANFTSMRGQIRAWKPTLCMNVTLACCRDPSWCTQSQLTGRIWLCVQNWSRDESIIILGTPFAITNLKCWNEIMFAFTLFMLPNLHGWTLILLACCCAHHGGSTTAFTWTLCNNSLGKYCRFDKTSFLESCESTPKNPIFTSSRC